jgi:hypothetical protein
MKKPYRVTAAADGSVRIAGRFHREGAVVHLSDKEAAPELSRGLVVPWASGGAVAPRTGVVGASDGVVVDPLDHDGDGRKGGSLPGRRRKA